MQICDQLEPYTKVFDSHAALENIRNIAASRTNGATKLRKKYFQLATLSDLVRSQIAMWYEPNEM